MAEISDPFEHARRGDVEYFKKIGISIIESAKNDRGDSVLMEAVKENHLACCQEICRRSPSLIYHKNNVEDTALHFSAWRGNSEIVKYLLYADSYIRGGEKIANKELLLMVNIDGGTPLLAAVVNRHIEPARILIQADPSHEQLLVVDTTKRTALHHAVELQDLEMVKLLVNQKPDLVYHSDVSGRTPLMFAMDIALNVGDSNSVKIRKFLMEKQASQIKLPTDQNGWTLLQIAAAKGDLGAVEDIIQFCPDCLEMVDDNGRNCLHHAATFGRVKVVERILQIPNISEKFLNAQDNYVNTPLHTAVGLGHASTALCLLYDSRVNKTIKNGIGQTALELITFDYDKERAGVFGVRDPINEKKLKDRSDFDLVVCALIVTVSFTSGIAVPGGYIHDGPNQGMAVLYKKEAFQAFIIANTCALSLSLSAVFSHFCTRLMHKRKDIDFHVTLATLCTLGAIFTMVVTFIMGSYAVLAISKSLAITVCLLCGSFFILAIYAMWAVAMQYKKPTRGASTNQETHTP